MLIYGYRGKKCLVSQDSFNETNLWALYRYNNGHLNYNDTNSTMVRHVYCSYSTLCKFNNLLTNTYEVDENYIQNIDFVKDYLDDNQDIENSPDNKCRSIYNHLRVWYNRLSNNPDCLDEIKWQVAKTMKHYEKQEIYRVASINLKRNYYDFVV